ncbi:hypothetical protein TPHA_0D02360 [Tetrapisispora phaffii CBS 4417]|uniref:Major facilitator superfamily (MFS) profile domain-containing protein n=1 Tax=Tetrapisispora phaffii (strain ATCC 24235 / CBS 4417 / NBRC 1672 / NRRL Y-8282 / UCD 70-5) TaxID=1071381 RepID=G8BSQ2_TETPH|nr:hypothetical protein TPHA_0D02360 [Tetrapisispora phaffii CBS 4417]CCE62873.1 hypothetical protein TPHA_0D02360 [Tetrapisispora phaffii CBS 4417]
MIQDDKHVTNPIFRDLPTNVNEWKKQLYLQQYNEITCLRPDFNLSDFNSPADDDQKLSQVLEYVDGFDSASTSTEKKMILQQISLKKNTNEEEETVASSSVAKYWPIFTAGAGLFSDGYINSSIGTVSLCLSKIYGDTYSESTAIQNVSSIAFAGTVVGQLLFGYLSDNYNRKFSMLLGTSLLILFSILCAGAWGVHTSGTEPGGLFAAITAYRFFLGIAIGSEYSSSSPAAAEASNLLPKEKRNRYFIWFTNFMIDFGFVIAAFVPLVLVWICGEKHLTPVWRITIGLGAIPPFSLFFMRLKYKESERFNKSKFQSHPPYWLVIKFYWFRTLVIATLWFIYDFSAYSFGTYSSIIIDHVLGKNPPLYQTLGWNVVFNVFYLPGAFLGAYFADYFGTRNTLAVFLVLQGAVGYIMAGLLEHLKKHIGGFVVIYGIFSTLGEVSGGDNIGCIASKSNATPVRGQVYAVSAAIGKVGAFVGSYVFPDIIKNAGGYDTTKGLQAPYLVSSSLCIFSAVLAYFCLPPLDPQSVVDEDIKFIEYLKSQGYDISKMGNSQEPTSRSRRTELLEKI